MSLQKGKNGCAPIRTREPLNESRDVKPNMSLYETSNPNKRQQLLSLIRCISFFFFKKLYCTLCSWPYLWYCLRNLVVLSEIRVSQYFLRGTCITNCASSQQQRYRRGEGSRRTMSHSSSLPPVECDLASLPLTSETHPVKSCIKVLTPPPHSLRRKFYGNGFLCRL